MNTLKLKNKMVLLPVILSIVYGVVAIYVTSSFVPLNRFAEEESFPSTFFRWMGLFIDLLLIAGIWVFLVRARAIWNYRIVFTDDKVRENDALTPFLSRKEISYSQIKSISYDWPGLIVISAMDGTKLKINVKAIDGGKVRVLDVLKTNIPNDVVEDSLAEKMDAASPYEKKYTFGLFIILIIYFAVLFAHEWLSVFPVGWNVYGHWGTSDVAGFFVESRDSIWVVTQKIGGDGEVNHYDGRDRISWKLPPPKTSISYSTVAILSDDAGQPTIITRECDIYKWNKNEWLPVNFPKEYEACWWFLDYQFASARNDAWFILEGKSKVNVLAKIHAGSNQIEIVVPPSYIEEYNPGLLSISPNGTLLVLAEDEEDEAVFILKNGEWQNKTYPIDPPEGMYVRDFTLDAQGYFYVLYDGFGSNNEIAVEITRDGHKLITKFPIFDDDILYEHLEVDQYGRLWLSGGHDSTVAVLNPIWGSVAEELVSYSEDNSSYSGDDNKFRLFQNGEIWSADRRLVWIDSDLKVLPRPLPVWISIISESDSYFRLFGYLVFLGLVASWHYALKTISRNRYAYQVSHNEK
jgi:hypothetical protein